MSWKPSKLSRKPNERLLRAAALFTWVENNLWIRTKRKIDVVDSKTGKKRKTQLVLLRYNAVQLILCQELARAWRDGRPFKVLVPKARQLGISTWFQSLQYALCVGESHYHVATVAHTEAGAEEVFSKTQTFHKELVPQPPLMTRQQNRLTLVNGSTTWTATVKSGDELGKGPTLSFLHLSECANFPDKGTDAMGAITSILNAIGDDPDVIVGYESTAKGRDPFFWVECERAKDPNSRTENRLIFLPWFLDPEYSMTWAEYKNRLKGKKLPSHFVLTSEEKLLRKRVESVEVTKDNYTYRYKATLSREQLIWRRFKIANDCFDKTHLFQRYYPSDYEEAFTSTVKSLFSQETRTYYLAGSRPAAVICNPVEAGVSTVLYSNPKGYTRVWSDVVPGCDYVIGADVGGEEKGTDPCAAYVLNANTLEVVAAVHGFLEFDHYASYLCLLGKYYNWARLLVENTGIGAAVAKTCFKQSYPNLYHYEDEASIRGTVAAKPGFNTNRKTRPEIVAYLDAACRDRKLLTLDAGFAREMEHFVWVENEKKYKAKKPHHDDRIMAMAIALYVCPGAGEDATREAVKKPSKAYLTFLRLEAEKGDEVHKGVLVL